MTLNQEEEQLMQEQVNKIIRLENENKNLNEEVAQFVVFKKNFRTLVEVLQGQIPDILSVLNDEKENLDVKKNPFQEITEKLDQLTQEVNVLKDQTKPKHSGCALVVYLLLLSFSFVSCLVAIYNHFALKKLEFSIENNC